MISPSRKAGTDPDAVQGEVLHRRPVAIQRHQSQLKLPVLHVKESETVITTEQGELPLQQLQKLNKKRL